jgi:hypothetical protein
MSSIFYFFKYKTLNNIMALYTFNTNLLSAEKIGNPVPTNAVLSGSGVNTISLSSNAEGITFDALTTLNDYLSTVNMFGSVYRIDTAYHNKQLAIVNTDNTYTVFTHNSATAVTPVSAIVESGIVSVSTPEHRRMRHLGYK